MPWSFLALSACTEALRAVHGQPGGRILAVGDGGAVVELVAAEARR